MTDHMAWSVWPWSILSFPRYNGHSPRHCGQHCQKQLPSNLSFVMCIPKYLYFPWLWVQSIQVVFTTTWWGQRLKESLRCGLVNTTYYSYIMWSWTHIYCKYEHITIHYNDHIPRICACFGDLCLSLFWFTVLKSG